MPGMHAWHKMLGEHTRTVMVELRCRVVDIARMLDQAIVFEPKAT